MRKRKVYCEEGKRSHVRKGKVKVSCEEGEVICEEVKSIV